MASQQADAELLQDALMLTSTGPIAGKLDMPGLQALSHTCKLFSAALKDAPTLFWQAALQHTVHKNFSLRLLPGSTPYREVVRLNARGHRMRQGPLPASCTCQKGPPPCVAPTQPTLDQLVILKQDSRDAEPMLKLHPLRFASPPRQIKVTSGGKGCNSDPIPPEHFSDAAEAVSPDGRWLVSSCAASATCMQLWNLTEGRPGPLLDFGPGVKVFCIRWAPTSRLLAAAFWLTALPSGPANNMVFVLDTSGKCTGSSLLHSLPAAAAADYAKQPFITWDQSFEWDATGTHLAGIVGSAVLVMRAPECSVLASVEAHTVLQGPLAGKVRAAFSWIPAPGGSVVVRVDTDSSQNMAFLSPATKQLSRSDHAPFGTTRNGAPVWSALGSSAGLVPQRDGSFEVCMWLPWDCVPRASGKQSGGVQVRSGTKINAFTQSWNLLRFSPDGTILAVVDTANGLTQTAMARSCNLTLRLLHWRTGAQLSSCSADFDMAGARFTPLRVPGRDRHGFQMGFGVRVLWATNGQAVHVGFQVYETGDEGNGISSNMVAALDTVK